MRISHAEQAIPEPLAVRQYALGLDAGVMLRKLHSIPAPAGQKIWGGRFRRKALRKIDAYRICPARLEGGETMTTYNIENIGLVDAGLPICWNGTAA